MLQKPKFPISRQQIFDSTTKPYKKLNLGVSQLDYVSDYKYLGLTIDTSLTFKKHLTNTLKLVSHKAYQLYKIRSSLSSITGSYQS